MAVVVAAAATAPGAAAQGPPPTPVPPYGSPSPYPQTLETPEPTLRPPKLTAPAAALVDLDSGRILFERGGTDRRPVASLTKIMTALLVVESTRPDDVVTASPLAASQEGSVLGLEPGERIEVRQLLYAIMLQSANDAAVALAEHVAGDVETFVRRMNRRARDLGLRDTRFASPNGLDDSGYSTARDMALLTVEAMREPRIAEAVGTRVRSIAAPSGPARRIQSRNVLLWLYQGATGVKTGWTAAAGFCLAASAERRGMRLAGVVLGASRDAFYTEPAALLDHGFRAHHRRVLARAGEPLDPVDVGEWELPVEAGRGLSAVVHRRAEAEAVVLPEDGLAPPILAGERVGRVVARSEGERLGSVPLVAAADLSVPEAGGSPQPSGEGESWWRRALGAVGEFVRAVFAAVA